MVWRLAALAMAMAMIGCSSSGEGASPTSIVETTTSTAPPTTTTTTTEPPSTTTTEGPEPEWTTEEFEVIEAYAAYQAAWDQAVLDWGAGIDAIRATTSGSYGSDVVAQFEAWRASDLRLAGSRTYAVVSVEFVDPQHALLNECGIDGFSLVDAGDTTVEPASEESIAVLLFLSREEGEWRVDGRRSQESC